MPRLVVPLVAEVINLKTWGIAAALAFASAGALDSQIQAAQEHGATTNERPKWSNTRLIGTPEPPPPYTVERAVHHAPGRAPIYVAAEPGTDHLLVVDRRTEHKTDIIRVHEADPDYPALKLIEADRRLIYGLTFHPGYTTNGHLFVFSNGPWGERDRTNRISRFSINRQAPYGCDPASELIILEWKSAGHDGGDLAFGNDGMLYIASGDGTSDSDRWLSAQDLGNLLGSILRIDVDRPGHDRPYSVPDDNPFVELPSARPEIWAYGLRNPWRMSVDRKTGHLWTGNNGQDMWETVHLVRRGENYGWSVYEGSHPFYLNRQRGPTPIVKPTIEHHHSEARSLTGGVVYYGDRVPDLNGVYIYGDYSTGKIWGARHDGTRLIWHRELADTSLQIAAFCVSPRGDLLIADLAGGIYRLTPTPEHRDLPPFPTRLSETGLFLSTKNHEPHPGLIAYSVNAPGWADGARADRWIALPGDAKIDYKTSRGWEFPNGSVLVQTLHLEHAPGNPNSERRIETRLLVRQQSEWTGYSYRWTDDQSDALLVGANGDEATIVVAGKTMPNRSEFRKQLWRFPSRAECMACHSRAANSVLGLSELQMNLELDTGGSGTNQLEMLQGLAVFKNPAPAPEKRKRLVNPYDAAHNTETRVRSYLHVNCSPCHIEAGGGNSQMELEFTTALDRMRLIATRPQHDTFGINDAMLVAPGDPERSILLHRLERRGPGQMPPLVSSEIDSAAVEMLRQWIAGLKPNRPFVRDWQMEDLLPDLQQLAKGRSFGSGRTAFHATGCAECHRFTPLHDIASPSQRANAAGALSGVGPDLTGTGRRLTPGELLESILLPSKKISEQYAATEIETSDGDLVSGRIEHEDDRSLVVRQNALLPETVIDKAKVIRRRQSTLSNMPSGIVNVLTKEEILDLLAYLIADGDPEHPAFAPTQ